MKKVIRKGVLMIGILTTIASYANKVSYTSTTNNIKKTTLTLNNVKQGHKLKIIDANGTVLYKEQIKISGEYSKGFDLTMLPNGNYIFELDKDVEIKSIPFKVMSNEVVFDKKSESSVFKPVVFKKGERIYISRYSIDENPLECKIYYEDNVDYISSEKFKDTKYAGKVYDFSKARKGNYKFVFKTEGRVFTQNVRV